MLQLLRTEKTINAVSPKTFHVCLISIFFFRSDDEETFCRALVEYTRACSHVGYPVREWRDSFPSCSKLLLQLQMHSYQIHIIPCSCPVICLCVTQVLYVCLFVDDGCEESFVYRDCISCCPPTCTFEKECLGTNLHCLDGCYCPDGI